MSDDFSSNSIDGVTPTRSPLPGTNPIGDIIMAVLFLIVGCLHLWRYSQTHTKYHVVMAGAVLVAILAYCVTFVAAYSFNAIVVNYMSPVLLFSEWIIMIIIAHLTILWSRSMGKVINQRAQLVYRFGIGGIVVHSISSALMISSWVIYLNPTTLAAFKAILILTYLGYGIALAFNLLSICLFIWQFVETKKYGISGLGFKRRQLLVLTVHCILIFIVDMFYFLGPVRAGHVFHVLVLSVGVYTREALTGFDEEPVVTSCIPAVIPTAVYDQQTVNMIDDPNVVFKQPGACQHHIGTEEAITTTPATDSNVRTASFPKSNTSPFSDDYALAVEDPVSNSIQMLDLIHKNS